MTRWQTPGTRARRFQVDELSGFAPAAATHGGKLYVSVGDGSLLVLDESRQV